MQVLELIIIPECPVKHAGCFCIAINAVILKSIAYINFTTSVHGGALNIGTFKALDNLS